MAPAGSSRGGSWTIRQRPSTVSVSLPRAWRLVRRRARVRVASARGAASRADQRQQQVGVDVLVPDGQFTLPGQPSHGLAVLPGGGSCRAEDVLLLVPVLPGRDRDTGREPFDVPLEGAGEGLVEVVEVEEQGAFRGGVQAEVQQVGVAAQLDGEPGVGLGGQVCRHDGGAPAQERER